MKRFMARVLFLACILTIATIVFPAGAAGNVTNNGTGYHDPGLFFAETGQLSSGDALPVGDYTVIPLCQAGIPFDSTKYAQDTPQSDPMVFQCYWDGTGHVYISGNQSSVTGIYADDGYTVTVQPSGATFDAPVHMGTQHPVVELTSGMTPGLNTFTLVVQNWNGLSMSYGSISGFGVDQTPYIVQVIDKPVAEVTVVPLCLAGTPFDAAKYPQDTPQSDPMIFQCYWDGTGQVYISGNHSAVTGVYADDGFTVTVQPSGATFDAPVHMGTQHPVVELTSGMTPGLNTFTLVVQNWMGLSMSYGKLPGTGWQTPYIVQEIETPATSQIGSKIGVFRPSLHTFYLDYNGNGAWNMASVDRQYNFGLTGDIPISGDWNTDGTTEIGVFRPSLHTFYLDYNGDGAWNMASVDRQYNFGLTEDIPATGDWNNDGKTEIGVFRPSTHMFHLDYDGNGAWNGAVTDRSYNFGLTGDIPATGDWNDDGKTEIGMFRPSTHTFYLDYNGNGAWNGAVTDRSYNFGLTGDKPATGDWNSNGKTEIGVFRPSTHMFYLDYNGNGAWDLATVDKAYNFGLTGDKPVSGKWS